MNKQCGCGEMPLRFRAWVNNAEIPFMAYQGTPDLETLKSFMFHYSDAQILMPFTGLTDRLGRDIYEGDIVKNHLSEFYGVNPKRPFYVVEFHQGGFRFVRGNHVFSREYWPAELTKPDNWEVIGNKFENKDLLL